MFSTSVLAAADVSQKIADISARFLEAPYQLEPLGEGPAGQFNQEPLFRFDRFDCETYVDTVLALALSNNSKQFEQTINAIRYKNNTPDFFDRNHFMSADWIPNNIQKKFVRYLAIPHFQLSEITKNIDKKQFYKNMELSRIKINNLTPEEKQEKLNQLRAHSDKVSNVLAKVYYIPFGAIPSVLKFIPTGSIVMILKPNSEVLITHMGLAVWKNNILYFRNASLLKQKVVDQNLLHYLAHQDKFKPILGIVVLTATNR